MCGLQRHASLIGSGPRNKSRCLAIFGGNPPGRQRSPGALTCAKLRRFVLGKAPFAQGALDCRTGTWGLFVAIGSPGFFRASRWN